MKNIILLTSLILLTSCVEKLKSRLESALGQKPKVEEAVEKEYIPEPPPSREKDQILQVSPKERLISLFEQFNRGPDSTLLQLVYQEFANNKSVFTAALDPNLATAFNRTIPNVQQGDSTTFQLLTQLVPLVVGENKDHLLGVLARGFDSAPGVLADYMSKRSEDKLCNFVLLVPLEVSVEAKRDFLETRVVAINQAKEGVGSNLAAKNYLDACLRTLDLHLAPMANESEAAPTAPAEPVEPPQPTNDQAPAPAPAASP